MLATLSRTCIGRRWLLQQVLSYRCIVNKLVTCQNMAEQLFWHRIDELLRSCDALLMGKQGSDTSGARSQEQSWLHSPFIQTPHKLQVAAVRLLCQ